MKIRKNILCIALTFALLMGMIVPLTVSASGSSSGNTTDSAGTYSKKVVSVLFDNSGSMRNSDNRDAYAKYAMQTLISLLGPEDTLIITPMNGTDNNAITSSSHGYEVDLSKPDRNAELRKAMSDSFLKSRPSGNYTPFSSVAYAVEQLTKRGMVTQDEVTFQTDSTEYWLFVITDGDFTDANVVEAERGLAQYSGKYSNLHTIYLGLGSDAKDLSKPTTDELKATKNFKAYYSKDVSGIINTMQQVANQISGRYTAQPAMYSVSGKQVTINLDNIDFAIHNLSILMQSSNATLVDASYNGKALKIEQACSIIPDSAIDDKLGNGYSALVKPASGFMAGGSLILTFNDNVNAANLSLLVEPALKLRTVVERLDGSNWVVTDREYINSKMCEGDQVRVGYEIYEEGSGRVVQITELFGEAHSNVTYAGKSYNVGDSIPLVVGNNDISVTVSVMDGAYVLYNTFSCIVETNPTFYRVEGSSVSTDNGIGNLYDVKFVVYANNVPLSKSELSAYQWSVIAKDANGAPVTVNPTVASDGSVTFSVDLSKIAFGESVYTMKVTSPEGLPREDSVTLINIPKNISIVSEGEAAMTKTQNQLSKNTAPFTFRLVVSDDKGNEATLSPEQCIYKLTVDGIDVTSHCKIEGKSITFTPNAETIGSLTNKLGTLEVRLHAEMKGVAGKTADATASITVTPTVYAVIPFMSGGTIDPFDIEKSGTTVAFAITRDGEYLSAEEIQSAYENNEFVIEVNGRNFIEKGLGSCRIEYSSATEGNVPVIRLTPQTRHFGALACFTGMFVFPGERSVTASYSGVDASETFSVANPGAWAYIWRILVLFLIIHILMLITERVLEVFFKIVTVCRLPYGTVVRVTFQISEDGRIVDPTGIARFIPVRHSLKTRFFWRRLFIPCVYWFRGNQTQTIEKGRILIKATGANYPQISIKYHKNYADAFPVKMLSEESEDFKIIEKHFASGKKKINDFNQKTLIFEAKPELFKSVKKSDERNKESKNVSTTQLGGFSTPICLSQNNGYYTFIFFIPDKR